MLKIIKEVMYMIDKNGKRKTHNKVVAATNTTRSSLW